MAFVEIADLAAADLQTGDRVTAEGVNGQYDVGTTHGDQGRIQVADTAGRMHSYHRTDTVNVTRHN
ncbi:MAG: hypothetical protein M3137_07300 [Actinomycetota bacterium]|nr:hypothetical protein [Actinomycetota bacterium]